MSSTPPLPIATDQRVLAAIVFTDVAGFSARMQKEETATLALLERDFATMRAFSEQLSGAVLKTTGDGLLLYFTSAVQAVSWALAVQRLFREQAKTTEPKDILRHRVGVHLGDVFVRANDVMGDGVNIAARVQAEAPPGGICISQVVYDVVKAKLKLDVVRLEPRRLKNISETIQMYHLLLEQPTRKIASGARPAGYESAATKKPPLRKRKDLAIGVAAVAIAGLGWYIIQAHFAHQNELAQSKATHAALGALLDTKDQPAKIADNPTTPTIAVNALGALLDTKDQPAKIADNPTTPTIAVNPTAEQDFAQLARDGKLFQTATAVDPNLQAEAKSCLQSLDAWLPNQLQRFTRDRPLIVRPLRDALSQDMTLFTDSMRRLCFEKGGAVRKQDWSDIKPEMQGAIIISTLRDLPSPAPRPVIRGAEAFAYLHRLPEMGAALLRDRQRGDNRTP
jgi:class 3 adenylate cyclase